jgi:hypothetical protein
MFAQYRTNTQIRSVPFVTQEFLGLAVFEFAQFLVPHDGELCQNDPDHNISRSKYYSNH